MFPEYQELISKLKDQDPRFLDLYDEHHELDKQITKLEKHLASDSTPEVKILKQKKLQLKEDILRILRSHGH